MLSQGDRGEVGPPGPAGFAGPPVSRVPIIHSFHMEYKKHLLMFSLYLYLIDIFRVLMVSLVLRESLVSVD